MNRPNNLKIIAFALFVLPIFVRAQFAVDSGTPDQTGNVSVFYSSPTDGQILAQKFTLTNATEITRIENFIKGFGQEMTVHLTSAIGTNATVGDVITNFTIVAPFVGGLNNGVWVAKDVNLSLAAGDYFLVFSATNSASFLTKTTNNIGPSYFASQGDGDINIDFPPASRFLVLNNPGQLGLRITGTNVVTLPGSVAIDAYPGITITGTIGASYRLDFATVVSPSTNWQTLTNILLPSSPYLFIDTANPIRGNRFYRAVLE